MRSLQKKNVGIIGCGVLGHMVAHRLMTDGNGRSESIRLVAISDAKCKKPKGFDGILFESEPSRIISAENIDIIVEAVGGVTSAYEVVSQALVAGKHVVTANKELMCAHGERLLKIAEGYGVQLRFEGALLGSLPCMSMLSGQFGDGSVKRIFGALSTTCNFALHRMEQTGEALPDALNAVGELGYIQENQQASTSGKDSLMTMMLLGATAFGKWPSMRTAQRKGIEGVRPEDMKLASRLGGTLKLISCVERDRLSVAPCFVDSSSMLGRIEGEKVGLNIESTMAGNFFLASGSGGLGSVAQAVAQDVRNISIGSGHFKLPKATGARIEFSTGEVEMPKYFIRLTREGREAMRAKPHIHILEEVKDTTCGDTTTFGALIQTGLTEEELLASVGGEAAAYEIFVG